MKKSVMALLAMSLLTTPFAGHIRAETEVKVNIDGSLVPFEQSPFIHNDFSMVPMREIFEKLGAELKWDQENQLVTAMKDDMTIQLKIGTPYVLRNYQQIPLDVPALVQNGRTFVPLRVISESFGANVAWDQQEKAVNITSSEKRIEVLANKTLTLEDAAKYAEAYSYDIKSAKQDIESNDIKMEEASDHLEYTPIDEGNGPDDAAVRSAFKQVASSNINYFMSKKQAEVAQDQVRYDVMKAYQDIFIKQNAVRNSEELREIAQMEEQAALAKAKMGRISEVEKNQISNAKTEAEKNLQTAKTALDDAWIKLNTLMGKEKESNYELADKPTYTDPEKWDVNSQISRMISSSPSIWLLEKQVELAELDVNLFTFNAGGNYDLTKMDVDKAQLNLAYNKENLEQSIRTMYSDMEKLKVQREVLITNLQTAEENLLVEQAKFAKGFNTALDVKKEQNTVNQRKRQLDELAIQVDQLRYKWNRPWTN